MTARDDAMHWKGTGMIALCRNGHGPMDHDNPDDPEQVTCGQCSWWGYDFECQICGAVLDDDHAEPDMYRHDVNASCQSGVLVP